MTSSSPPPAPKPVLGPRHVLLASMAMAALAFFGWRALGPGSRPGPFASRPSVSRESPEPGALPGARATGPAAAERRAAAELEPRSTAPVDEPSLIRVHGRITVAGGAPLGNDQAAFVRFTDLAGGAKVARAKASGEYSISGLTPGPWWCSATSQGYLAGERHIQLDPLELERREDFALEPQVGVKVKVTSPEGDPIFEALRAVEPPLGSAIGLMPFLPIATRTQPGEWLFETRGSLNNPLGIGHYAQNGFDSDPLPEEYIGILQLDERPPVWINLVLYHYVLASQRIEAGATEVAFVLDPEELRDAFASVRMRLVDAVTGEPLSSPMVHLTGGSSAGAVRERPDADGVLVAEDQTPGKHELVIGIAGYELYRAEVLLESGTLTDLGRIGLQPAVTIRGVVTDADGAPLSTKVRQQRLDQPGSKQWGIFLYEVQADEQGAFEFTSLAPGEYLVSVGGHEEPRRSAGVVVDTRAGPVDDVQLVVCEPAALVLVPPANWRGLRFALSDAAGHEVGGGSFYSGDPRRLEFAPGAYTLVLRDANGDRISQRPVQLGPDPLVIEL